MLIAEVTPCYREYALLCLRFLLVGHYSLAVLFMDFAGAEGSVFE